MIAGKSNSKATEFLSAHCYFWVFSDYMMCCWNPGFDGVVLVHELLSEGLLPCAEIAEKCLLKV